MPTEVELTLRLLGAALLGGAVGVEREISDQPKTAYEVSRIVFRGTLTEHQRCFALAETLAHLDHLVLEGRAEGIENETVNFRAA
jgi:hypothetical protein